MRLDGLLTHETPPAPLPTMVVAFAGWPDAAEAATRALRYLVRKLGARKFAEVDPEEFYDFTLVRPRTRVNRRGERVIRWPRNDFYHFLGDDDSGGLLLYVGTEPNLRWRAFSRILTGVAKQNGVRLIVSLGALLDAVPHTRPPRVSGRASLPELTQKAEWMGIRNSAYQGPTGIHTAFMAACDALGLAHASIWGHVPHYANRSPNPIISHALLAKLRSLVTFDADLEEIRQAGEAFGAEMSRIVEKDTDLSAYVSRLEQRYDAAHAQTTELPNPEGLVEDLEQFLKSQREARDGGESG